METVKEEEGQNIICGVEEEDEEEKENEKKKK